MRALVGALLMLSATTGAQTADSARGLRKVLVIADRVPVPADRQTSSVTVIDARALREAGVTHLTEALRRVPGFQVVRSGSFGAPVSLFVRGGESDYVRVLIDGVPQNDPGGAMDLGAITLDGVERVEVVRGASSVQYGSDAISGVVNIVTRRSEGPLHGQLLVGAGSYGNSTVDGTLGGRRGAWSARTTLARQSSDGTLPFNSGYRSDVGAVNLSHAGPTTWTINLREARADVQFPTDGAGAVVDRNARRDDDRTTLAAELQRMFGEKIRWHASSSVLRARGGIDDRPDDADDVAGFTTYLSRGATRRVLTRSTADWSPTPTTTISVGGEWMRERQSLTDSSNFSSAWSDFAESRGSTSAFVQGLGTVGRMSYALGARTDRNSTFGSFETGRLHVGWQLGRGWRARGAVGTAFKAPGLAEQFNTPFTVGSDSLRPERTRSNEAALSYRHAGIEFEATWFDQRFRDLIQYTFLSPTAPSYYNVAAATARGVEVAASGPVGDRLNWRAHTTWLRTRVDNAGFDNGPGATFVQGGRLLRRPDRAAGAGVEYRVRPTLTLDVQSTYVGRREDRDFSGFPAAPVVLDAFTRFDVGIQARLPTRAPLTIMLRADNVFGARYAEVVGFPAPRRTLFAGLRTEWLR